jgi:O-antigen/teichoic acid export membrane protein
MLGLAAIVEPLILFLIGEKWLPSADILFYMCFAGILFPFELLNMNILKVHGQMNTYLGLELMKVFLVVPVLYIGVFYGLKTMLVSLIIHSIVSFLISARFSGKLINYSYREYINDLKIPLLLSLIMFFIVYTVKGQIEFNPLITLIILIITGVSTMILLYELSANREYKEFKKNIL